MDASICWKPLRRLTPAPQRCRVESNKDSANITPGPCPCESAAHVNSHSPHSSHVARILICTVSAASRAPAHFSYPGYRFTKSNAAHEDTLTNYKIQRYFSFAVVISRPSWERVGELGVCGSDSTSAGVHWPPLVTLITQYLPVTHAFCWNPQLDQTGLLPVLMQNG